MIDDRSGLDESKTLNEAAEINIASKKMYTSIQIGMICILFGIIIRVAAIMAVFLADLETEGYILWNGIGIIILAIGAIIISFVLIDSAIKRKDFHPYIRAAMIIGGVIILAFIISSNIYYILPLYSI